MLEACVSTFEPEKLLRSFLSLVPVINALFDQFSRHPHGGRVKLFPVHFKSDIFFTFTGIKVETIYFVTKSEEGSRRGERLVRFGHHY